MCILNEAYKDLEKQVFTKYKRLGPLRVETHRATETQKLDAPLRIDPKHIELNAKGYCSEFHFRIALNEMGQTLSFWRKRNRSNLLKKNGLFAEKVFKIVLLGSAKQSDFISVKAS